MDKHKNNIPSNIINQINFSLPLSALKNLKIKNFPIKSNWSMSKERQPVKENSCENNNKGIQHRRNNVPQGDSKSKSKEYKNSPSRNIHIPNISSNIIQQYKRNKETMTTMNSSSIHNVFQNNKSPRNRNKNIQTRNSDKNNQENQTGATKTETTINDPRKDITSNHQKYESCKTLI
jgi:hypothetical protein